MFFELNYKKSRKLKKVILKTDLINLIISALCYVALTGFVPIVSIINISKQIHLNTYYHNWLQNSILIIVSIAWVTIWILWLKKGNDLFEIGGVDKIINRVIITEVLKSNWRFTRNNKDYIIAFPDNHHWINGRYLIVLFEGDNILINVFSFSWRNIKTPFFVIKDLKVRDEIKKEFTEKIKNHVA